MRILREKRPLSGFQGSDLACPKLFVLATGHSRAPCDRRLFLRAETTGFRTWGGSYLPPGTMPLPPSKLLGIFFPFGIRVQGRVFGVASPSVLDGGSAFVIAGQWLVEVLRSSSR